MKLIALKNEGTDNQSHDAVELTEIISSGPDSGLEMTPDGTLVSGRVSSFEGAWEDAYSPRWSQRTIKLQTKKGKDTESFSASIAVPPNWYLRDVVTTKVGTDGYLNPYLTRMEVINPGAAPTKIDDIHLPFSRIEKFEVEDGKLKLGFTHNLKEDPLQQASVINRQSFEIDLPSGFEVSASTGAPNTTNTADMPTKMVGKGRTLTLGEPDVWAEVQHEGKTYLMPLYEKV